MTTSSEDAVGAPAVATAPMRAVFVGGSGRSGTTPTARLVGKHSRLAMVPAELRVHVRPRGLVDLVRGRTTIDFFSEQMTGRWFRRPHVGGHMERDEAGLHEITDLEAVARALATLREGLPGDPVAAGRRLLHDLLDPIATAEGASGWIEHSPENVTVASELHRMFPDMKFIHSVRDGRDAASSMTRVPWGPDNIPEAIRWWGRRLVWAHEEISKLPPGTVFVLRFEDLIERDREGTYRRLLEFLELDDEPAMHAYFDEAIVPDKAHIGRWNDDVPADERDDIDRLYDGVLERLRDAGAPLPATADQHPRMEGTERELAVTRQLLYERESEVADARLEVEEVESELEVVKGERDRALEQRDRAREQLEEAQERHETAKTQVEKVAKLRDKAVETRDKLRGLLEEAANQNSDLRRQLERMRLPDPGSR